MDDARIWDFEKSLWTGDADNYRAKISDDVVMALPAEPFLFTADAAVAAVSATPRWHEAEFSDKRVSRPQEGLIVIGYCLEARRGDEAYRAHCTTVMQRLGEGDWNVIQHQQSPILTIGG